MTVPLHRAVLTCQVVRSRDSLIARAIAKDPKIYIFDDSFSALDLKTDAALRKALSSKVKDKHCYYSCTANQHNTSC